MNRERQTKIVATLGPASEKKQVIQALVKAGVDVFRLNFSHGTHEAHQKAVKIIRSIEKTAGHPIGIMADLQGPKIRIARFKHGGIELVEGAIFVLDAALGDDEGDIFRVGIDYKALPHDVKRGDTLLLDDGRVVLWVEKVHDTQISNNHANVNIIE